MILWPNHHYRISIYICTSFYSFDLSKIFIWLWSLPIFAHSLDISVWQNLHLSAIRSNLLWSNFSYVKVTGFETEKKIGKTKIEQRGNAICKQPPQRKRESPRDTIDTILCVCYFHGPLPNYRSRCNLPRSAHPVVAVHISASTAAHVSAKQTEPFRVRFQSWTVNLINLESLRA